MTIDPSAIWKDAQNPVLSGGIVALVLYCNRVFVTKEKLKDVIDPLKDTLTSLNSSVMDLTKKVSELGGKINTH